VKFALCARTYIIAQLDVHVLLSFSRRLRGDSDAHLFRHEEEEFVIMCLLLPEAANKEALWHLLKFTARKWRKRNRDILTARSIGSTV
jgi:hypothetical protein